MAFSLRSKEQTNRQTNENRKRDKQYWAPWEEGFLEGVGQTLNLVEELSNGRTPLL